MRPLPSPLALSFLVAMAGCTTPTSEDEDSVPVSTMALHLAHPNPARIGESTYLQAFVTMTTEGSYTSDNLFEGRRSIPTHTEPVSFELARAGCDDGTCSVERLDPWDKARGLKIHVVPHAIGARLRAVTTTGLAAEITLRYQPDES